MELSKSELYIAISNTVKKYKLKNMISYLCKVAGVSRSGFYKYFSKESIAIRKLKDIEDEIIKENVLKAFKFKNRQKGARQIKMVLENEYGIKYNLKRIRIIMKKYDLICSIRKATQEHTVLPNILNREFKQEIAEKVLLTDITYLPYSNGKYVISINS